MQNNYLENIIFFYVISNKDLIRTFKPYSFREKAYQILFALIQDHFNNYNEIPTENQLIDIIKLKNLDSKISIDNVHELWKQKDTPNSYTDEWLREQAISYAEWNHLVVGLTKSTAYVKSIASDVDVENVNDYISRAKTLFNTFSDFNMNVSEGYDFLNPKSHQSRSLDTTPIGYKFIDSALNGGLSKKTLNVFMGPPKVGKSMWLCNLAAKSVLSGQNTIYITLEMSHELVAQRIGSILLKIPIKEYTDVCNDETFMAKKLSEWYKQNNGVFNHTGRLFIEEFPTSTATAQDIAAFVLKKEEELSQEGKPFKFDNIFIDYINIMAASHNNHTESLYIKIKNICEEVRAVAQENQWCIVSATQTNRTGFNTSDVDMTSVSESAGLVATVDALFAIIQDTLMKVNNCYYIKALALRNSELMGDRKKYLFNPTYLSIAEDETEDIITEASFFETQQKSRRFNRNDHSQQPQQSQQSVEKIDKEIELNKPKLEVTEAQIRSLPLIKRSELQKPHISGLGEF